MISVTPVKITVSILCLFAITLGVVGCASSTSGQSVNFDGAKSFHKGQIVTKSDVIAVMGPAPKTFSEKDGKESWLYQHITTKAGGLNPTIDQRSESAIFLFEGDKLVDLTRSLNTVRSQGKLTGGAEAGPFISKDQVTDLRSRGVSTEQLLSVLGEPYTRKFSWDGSETWTYVHVKTGQPTTSAVFKFENDKVTSANWDQKEGIK
jgi:hypothetical protein